MKKILIIDSSDVGAKYTADAIIEMGYEPIFLVNLDDFQGDTVKQIKRYAYFEVNTKSIEALEKIIQQYSIRDIEGVFTALDSKIPIAIQLAEKLKVRGLSPNLLKISTKDEVSELISEYSPKSISIKKSDLQSHLQSIAAMSNMHKKLVLKPNNAAGGVGVLIVSSPINMDVIENHLNQFNFNNWLLMEFITGDLVSLEGFFYRGQSTFLGFTSRNKIGNTESYMEFPIDDNLSERIKSTAKNAIEALAQKSGYSHGYFHTEFMINDQQCILIDANFGRLGGGPLIDLIAVGYNVSSVDIMKHIIAVSLYGDLVHHKSPYRDKPIEIACGVNYGLAESASLININMPSCSQSITHTQLLDFGTHVPAMGSNNWAWIGLLSGKKNSVLNVVRDMTLETDKGITLPCY